MREDWANCNLDDLVIKMTNGSSAKQFNEKVGLPISRIETIWNELIDFDRVKYIYENDADFIEKYSLKNNDILLSHINSDSHLGKTAIYKSKYGILIHGINVLLLRPSNRIDADFLNYQLKYLRFKGNFIAVAQRAVNQSSINQQKLKKFELKISPFLEQKAIVAKIEQLFSELDKGIESLKTAQTKLKIYRQAVLKKAFEGDYKLVEIGDVCDVFVGATPSRKNTNYWDGDIYWVSSGEVKFNTINNTKEKITEEGLKNTSTVLHPPQTILLAMIGEGKTRGQCAILNIHAAHNQNTAALRAKKELLDFRFLYNFLVYTYEDTRRIGSGNNQKALNKARVSALTLPLPTIEEQNQIVQEIESHLSLCDKIEQTISDALIKAEALRKSILKKAFEGKLLHVKELEIIKSYPEYESAEKLLQRIKLERAK